jgi:predicted nuclease with TOPRIM domain
MIEIIEFIDGYSIREYGRTEEIGAVLKRDGWTRAMVDQAKDIFSKAGNEATEEALAERDELERENARLEDGISALEEDVDQLKSELAELKK